MPADSILLVIDPERALIAARRQGGPVLYRAFRPDTITDSPYLAAVAALELATIAASDPGPAIALDAPAAPARPPGTTAYFRTGDTPSSKCTM